MAAIFTKKNINCVILGCFFAFLFDIKTVLKLLNIIDRN